MKIGSRERIFVLLWLHLLGIHTSLQSTLHDISRENFPSDFIFGVGTSAYQVEGAAAEDGRKPSIWDTYTHAGKSIDGSTGDIASDQYHHYKEDVRLMYEMGLDAYRFSISWSRLIPDGKGAVNPKGLEYYNSLIDELIWHGIQPHITIHHFDLPQSLQDAYGGWLNPQIVEVFRDYAEVCFREFGDRVKYWTTFNESNVLSLISYDFCSSPSQRCSYPYGKFGNCSARNIPMEPYIAGHNLLLSHAAAVELYREKFQVAQKGFIGITILVMWYVPLTNKSMDIAATKRALDFFSGWFIDPIVFGDYPSSMKEVVGFRLPTFTKQQSEKLRGSFDFLGLNHYGTSYVSDLSDYFWNTTQRDYFGDMAANMTVIRDGIPIGKFAPSGLPIVPWGMQELLEYFKKDYDNPPIIIYENGYGERNNDSLSVSEALNDKGRVEYLHDYFGSLLAAIRNGSNTRGYFVWTLLDCYEFLFGYNIRYGLIYLDFNDNNLKRHPKLSVGWYTRFLKQKQDIDLVKTDVPVNDPLPIFSNSLLRSFDS